MSVEPIVLEYNPAEEEKEAVVVEDEREPNENELIDIHITTSMEEPPQPRPERRRPTLWNSIVQAGAEVLHDIGMGKGLNQVELADGPDFAEVYTEVTKAELQKARANVTWRLRNASPRFKWSEGMELMPVFSAPRTRINFETNIC